MTHEADLAVSARAEASSAVNPLTIDQIIPNKIYYLHELAEVFRCNIATLRSRVKDKRLISLPYQGNEPILVLGVEALRYAGLPASSPETPSSKPPRGETSHERRARGKAAVRRALAN